MTTPDALPDLRTAAQGLVDDWVGDDDAESEPFCWTCGVRRDLPHDGTCSFLALQLAVYGESRETLTTVEVQARGSDYMALPNRVLVGANGAYWRDFGTHLSMCVVSEDNDPVEVIATYAALPEASDLTEDSLYNAMQATRDNKREGAEYDNEGDWREWVIDILARLRDTQP